MALDGVRSTLPDPEYVRTLEAIITDLRSRLATVESQTASLRQQAGR